MKHILSFALVIALITGYTWAQTNNDTVANNGDSATVAAAGQEEDEVIFPRCLIGVRGGLNMSDMVYSHKPVNRYKHVWQPQGMVGLFGHFQLGESNLSLRPEVTLIGRADSLVWKDVEYRMKAHYVDFRLPIVYNFRFRNSCWSPYLMVVPEFGMAYGGKINYHAEDFPNGVTAKITRADINDYDAGVMFGLGMDILVKTGGMPFLLSFEGGYNMGLLNTFAQREIKDNPDVVADNRSIIANNFFGAELWQETRNNRGIEVAMRLAMPLDNSWKKKPKPIEQVIDTDRKSVV